MFLSWRSRFGLGPNEHIGIEASGQGLAVARVGLGSGMACLHHCEFITGSSATAALNNLTAGRRLGRLPCNWLLPPDHYNLLLLEAPRVEPEELREALRWQIKDLISFPVDQAILDIFELPEDGSRGRKMVYVAAAQRKHIEDTAAASRAAGLRLSSIDIGELALRNIAERMPSQGRGVAIARVQQERGSIVLVRGGQLYLSRQFELPWSATRDEALPEDNLILELQRSLDYYERQMAQEAPERILLCGDNINADSISQNMRSSLAAPVDYLQLNGLLAGSEAFAEPLLQRCIGAIGAALRGEAE